MAGVKVVGSYLKEPTPTAQTAGQDWSGIMSEELKPVNCGCGGESVVRERVYGGYEVYCSRCFITTDDCETETEAIQAWNRAMGAGKSEIAITKGYWMTTYDGLHCSVCNYKCETTALPEVCPHCGTRLIRW